MLFRLTLEWIQPGRCEVKEHHFSTFELAKACFGQIKKVQTNDPSCTFVGHIAEKITDDTADYGGWKCVWNSEHTSVPIV